MKLVSRERLIIKREKRERLKEPKKKNTSIIPLEENVILSDEVIEQQINLDNTCNTDDEMNNSKSIATQVELEVHTKFIRKEKDLISMTGIPSFSLLSWLEKLVTLTVPNFETLIKKSSKLTIKDRIVLTFFKLKQNISYSVIRTLSFILMKFVEIFFYVC